MLTTATTSTTDAATIATSHNIQAWKATGPRKQQRKRLVKRRKTHGIHLMQQLQLEFHYVLPQPILRCIAPSFHLRNEAGNRRKWLGGWQHTDVDRGLGRAA